MNFKYHWYRAKYNHGKHLPLTTPVDLLLELSSYCNQSCIYCYFNEPDKLPFKMKFMDTDLACSLIDQASKIGVSSIKFNGRGEASLHKDYAKIVKRAYDKGTFIDMICNSNFKFPNKREDLFLAFCMMTKVKISFDSFDKKVFESQRIGGKIENALANIDKLYHYPGRDNEMIIQAVRTELNKDEPLEQLIKERWPNAKASVRDVVAGRNEKDIDDYRDFDNREPCKQAFVRLIVHSDGKVAPCCPSIRGDLIIGDTSSQTLKQIFNSYEAKKIRRDLKSGRAFESDPCSTCPSHESFKGNKGVWGS